MAYTYTYSLDGITADRRWQKKRLIKLKVEQEQFAKLMNGGKKAQNEHIGHLDKLKLSGI